MKLAPNRCDVAICGGGLGGLALAAGLFRRGYNVHIFEASAELRTATSTLIGLGANAFTALDDLHPDIVPQLKAKGCIAQVINGFTKLDKTSEVEARSTPVAQMLLTIRWSVVQNTLARLVPPELVHCGYQATGYTEDADSGVVRLHFKGKPDVEARLAVGADGLRSAVRKTMVPNDPGPRYLGHMNWNALIHNPQGSVVDAHKPGELQTHSNRPQVSAQQWTIMSYVIDAGCGYTFWQVRIESEQPSFTPAPGSSTLDNDSSSTDPGSMQPQPYLVGGGLGKPGSKARVEQLLTEAGFEHVLKVVQATPESSIFERAMLDRVPLDELGATMSSPGGRVVLLGDAAHPMHPGPGQGARTAFEDAHTLTVLLDQHRQQLVQLGWAPAPPELDAALYGQESASCHVSTSSGNKTNHNGPEVKQLLQAPAQPVPSARPSDEAEVLSQVLAGYNHARLVRTCRVQRFAAEGCGLESIRQALRPQGVTTELRMVRFTEFSRWLGQYPNNPTGDPASQYFKPLDTPPLQVPGQEDQVQA